MVDVEDNPLQLIEWSFRMTWSIIY